MGSIVLFVVAVLALLAISVKIAIAVRNAFALPLLLLLDQLSLVILLVVDLYKAGKPLVWGDASLALQDVDHDAVRSLLDPLEGEASLLGETSLVAEVGLVAEVVDAVEELASLSVHAVAFMLVLTAELGLVVRWQVLLRHELIHVVRVGAGIPVLAVLVHEDVPAHLRLLHLLDFLVELEPLFPVHELLLLRRSGSLTSEARDVIEVVVDES